MRLCIYKDKIYELWIYNKGNKTAILRDLKTNKKESIRQNLIKILSTTDSKNYKEKYPEYFL